MRRILTVTPLLVLVAAACTGTKSYKDQTEDFVNDNAELASRAGGDITGAECVEPDSTEVGTKYQCTADVAGVGPLTFDIEIDKKNSFRVTVNPS
jgi:hypothetical protein